MKKSPRKGRSTSRDRYSRNRRYSRSRSDSRERDRYDYHNHYDHHYEYHRDYERDYDYNDYDNHEYQRSNRFNERNPYYRYERSPSLSPLGNKLQSRWDEQPKLTDSNDFATQIKQYQDKISRKVFVGCVNPQTNERDIIETMIDVLYQRK